MRRAEAEAAGYMIDDHCNPPVAYKGPRFDPDEIAVLEPDHAHTYEYVSPGRRICYGCGARLAVEVQFHEAPHSTTLGAPTLRGSDVTWAQQFRPDRKGQTDG